MPMKYSATPYYKAEMSAAKVGRMSGLPIDSLLPQILEAMRQQSTLVLQAAPGAGKTTRVPSALLDAGIAGDGRILVLEPRRIAARAAAEFVAGERGSAIGTEVGYRVRFEQQGTSATRLWFVTEGVFTRRLTTDPFLEGISLIVLDEFHERHLQTDLALASVLELQRSVRPELKLLVMSATLEAERVAAHLGDAGVLRSAGRAHPVRIDHFAVEHLRLGERVMSGLRHAVATGDDGGDILVFLPGAGEIRRVSQDATAWAVEHDIDIVPLHGDLPLAEQYRAIRPGPRRRLILSTNVAETALTAEGVTVVVDSGLARVVRFDARHGINSLSLARISRASAEQRAGRAGRVRPGRCLRLWSLADHQGRVEHESPEIRRLDLSELLLELKAWGLADPRSLPWLDPPAETAWRRAAALLEALGAIDAGGGLTTVGRRMLRLSLPPRLARILVEAESCGGGPRTALVAALASERDICLDSRAFGGDRAAPGQAATEASDLLNRVDLFEQAARSGFDAATCAALRLDRTATRSVDRSWRQLVRALPPANRRVSGESDRSLLRCILAGFPDRVVRRREPGSSRGVMVGGKGIVLAPTSAVREAELFVAVEMEGAVTGSGGGEARVRIASAIERSWLSEMFPDCLRREVETELDPVREAVVEWRRTRFLDLVLEQSLGSSDPERAAEVLAAAVRTDPLRAVEPGAAARSLLDRLVAARRWMPELELPDPVELLADTVVDLCSGRRSFAELRRIDLLPWLQARLGPMARRLEQELPVEYLLPSGRRARIRYERDRPPAVAARIQELFGLAETPRVARGRIPLVFELLAPNQRPVQITDDLASFWRGAYLEVRKQLRGRYPRHSWPEDPWTAQPTSRVRPPVRGR